MFFLSIDCCGRRYLSEVPNGTPLPKNGEICDTCQDLSWEVQVISRSRARHLVTRKVFSSLLPGTAEAFNKEIKDEQAKKEEVRKRTSFQNLLEYLDESLRVHRYRAQSKTRR